MAETSVDVSVIVAVRNGAATLKQCIDSVLEQTGCTVELIIVDAMSDDGTQEIVELFGDRIAIYIREPDRGIYDAWNKALAVTRGEWCAFLGADDYFLSEGSFASLLGAAREPREPPVFVHGGNLRVGAVDEYVMHPDPSDALSFLRSGHMLPHPGSLHSVTTLRAIGGFDDSFRIAGDMDAVLRMLHHGSGRRADAVVTAMRVGGVSGMWSAHRERHRERWRILRAELGPFAALRPTLQPFLLERLGYFAEVALLAVCGRRRGASLVLTLRRRFGQAPKLHTMSNDAASAG